MFVRFLAVLFCFMTVTAFGQQAADASHADKSGVSTRSPLTRDEAFRQLKTTAEQMAIRTSLAGAGKNSRYASRGIVHYFRTPLGDDPQDPIHVISAETIGSNVMSMNLPQCRIALEDEGYYSIAFRDPANPTQFLPKKSMRGDTLARMRTWLAMDPIWIAQSVSDRREGEGFEYTQSFTPSSSLYFRDKVVYDDQGEALPVRIYEALEVDYLSTPLKYTYFVQRGDLPPFNYVEYTYSYGPSELIVYTSIRLSPTDAKRAPLNVFYSR